jgi:hypothetical protein
MRDYTMKTYVKVTAMLALLTAATLPAAHAETWHTSPIKNIYPLADGSFVLIMRNDAAGCAGTTNKYHYVSAGEFGVTAEGVKAMLATALTAYAMDRRISLLFDETRPQCYINRLQITD